MEKGSSEIRIGGASNYGEGFLPTAYGGIPLRSSGDPVLSSFEPPRYRPAGASRVARHAEPETAARTQPYEMAYKLQQSEPELRYLADKSKEPLVRCGIDDPNKAGYARNCLLARRLKERGLLDDTIVILGGEFGRPPMVQGETMSATITAGHSR